MNNSYIGEMKELLKKVNSREFGGGEDGRVTMKRSIEIQRRKSVHIDKIVEKAENPREHFYNGIDK